MAVMYRRDQGIVVALKYWQPFLLPNAFYLQYIKCQNIDKVVLSVTDPLVALDHSLPLNFCFLLEKMWLGWDLIS